MKTLWFKAKKYGYGWTPCSWQGWLIILVYLLVMLVTFRSIDLHSHSGSDTLIAVFPFWLLYTFVLLLICSLTGEKPRWRWGE